MERTSEFSIHQHFRGRQRDSKNGPIFGGWVRRPDLHTQSPQFAVLPSLVFTLALVPESALRAGVRRSGQLRG